MILFCNITHQAGLALSGLESLDMYFSFGFWERKIYPLFLDGEDKIFFYHFGVLLLVLFSLLSCSSQPSLVAAD